MRAEIEELQSTIKSLRNENESLELDPANLLEDLVDSQTPVSLNPETGKKTLEVWQAIRQAFADEQAFLASNAGKLSVIGRPRELVEIRAQASNLSGSRIGSIVGAGADPAVVRYASKLASWNRSRRTLYIQAGILLRGDEDGGQAGTLGEKWVREEAHLRQEESTLAKQGDALREYLQTTYGLEFPSLR